MATGERIRWFRNSQGMTQKDLGLKVGFPERNADIRIRQYEIGQRNPKADMISELAGIFDVADEALSVPDIDNYIGLMHTLFALEDMYGLTIAKVDGQVCLKMDVNHDHYDMGLAQDLIDWYEQKDKVNNGSMLIREYDHWRYSYPKDKAEEFKASLDSLREKKQERKRD